MHQLASLRWCCRSRICPPSCLLVPLCRDVPCASSTRGWLPVAWPRLAYPSITGLSAGVVGGGAARTSEACRCRRPAGQVLPDRRGTARFCRFSSRPCYLSRRSVPAAAAVRGIGVFQSSKHHRHRRWRCCCCQQLCTPQRHACSCHSSNAGAAWVRCAGSHCRAASCSTSRGETKILCSLFYAIAVVPVVAFFGRTCSGE